MAKGQRLKNQIHANCIVCNTKRLVAYWDDELESYIYLCDESQPICMDCTPVAVAPSIAIANAAMA